MKKVIIMIAVALMVTSCGTMERSVALGGLLGGGTGAVVGKKTGNTWRGAAIGTVIGGITGYGVHKYKDGQATQDRRLGELERRKQHDPLYTPAPRSVPRQEQGEVVIIKRRKVITVNEEVPVQRETRKYYIDPRTGRKVYMD
jgi:hypothetical protein